MIFLEFKWIFPAEKADAGCFPRVRYGGTLVCPRRGAKVKVCRYRKRVKARHRGNCNKSFSPFSNTIFGKSAASLVKWFYAIHLLLNGKKGISGCQLQREIGVTYKTRWRMLRQIRMAMGNEDTSKAFSVLVEIDETRVGGRPRGENAAPDKNGTPAPGDSIFFNRRKTGLSKVYSLASPVF
jgi:hypothetical protein